MINLRQDAMTSVQVYLKFALLLMLFVLSGCQKVGYAQLRSPYSGQRVFAVAPFVNKSGNNYANVYEITDAFRDQLSSTQGLIVLPVDDTLAAMGTLGMDSLQSVSDAKKLLVAMGRGVDGLIVGHITSYDPYSPPKIGMSLELYLSANRFTVGAADPGHLTRQATGDQLFVSRLQRQPVSRVSETIDAKHPYWRSQLKRYAKTRGQDFDPQESHIKYRESIDLYSEFVSFMMSQRLLEHERIRLEKPSTQPNAGKKTNLP